MEAVVEADVDVVCVETVVVCVVEAVVESDDVTVLDCVDSTHKWS